MDDDDLAELLRAAPPRSMMLLEDVDAIFVDRTAQKDKGQRGGISFSGLLNALDGAAAQEGCVIMLTTNHKDRLDEALIRPGRCDVHVRVDKASQNQARRMFNRFFAKEATVASVQGSEFAAKVPHRFPVGAEVSYRSGVGGTGQIFLNDVSVDEGSVFYVGPGTHGTSFKLYDTSCHAMAGGSPGLLHFSGGGGGGKFQENLESASRFATRIPEKQVSMAKLQGYLMKQKLLAEQELQKRIVASGESPSSDEVHHLAAQSAVINVHELLDVKVEAEEVHVPIFEHLRRVGLHKFAPFFEHFGIRERRALKGDVKDAMDKWDPDLKIAGPQKKRLVALIEGNDKELDRLYALSDLSVLRDRFLTAFRKHGEHGPPEDADASPPAGAPPPLARARSAPAGMGEAPAPSRATLLRMSSGVLPDSPASRPDGVHLLEMAHTFQEKLEDNGKTEVSLWQLEKHFERFAGDPAGALEHCEKLLKTSAQRAASERKVQWATTFGFLRRLGLEDKAFALEDAGFKFWNDWKHLSKDEIKEKGGMSDQEAAVCHAVIQGNAERADLLRDFQIPEFADIEDFFSIRFPSATAGDARAFALALTDELGAAEFSCLQVRRYLEAAKSPGDAKNGIEVGLQPLSVAEQARVRPPPPPKEEPVEDWLQQWLKGAGLEHLVGKFREAALEDRETIVDATINEGVLEKIGVTKIGEQTKLLKMTKLLKT